MLRIRRVLFPTDYSASAESAFVQAVFLAERFGAELHVLNVQARIRPFGNSSDLTAATIPEDVAVPAPGRRIYQKAWAHGVPVVQSQKEAPSAWEGILDYAEDHDVDLIVLGTHGRRGINRLLMGSVAEKVVRHATIPVYTVRMSPGPNLNHRPRRIVAPVDFSEHSRNALVCAGEMARAYGGVVEVLHVIEDAVLPQAYGIEPVTVKANSLLDRHHEALEEVIEELDLGDVAGPGHILFGHPALGIVDFSRHNDVDLIVIGTHGRSGLSRFVLGSVTEKVVRLATCPVFTVRSFGRQLIAAEMSLVESRPVPLV